MDEPGPVDEAGQQPERGELDAHAAELLQAAEDAAAAKGRAMVAEARAVRARMIEDADRRRELVRAELERAAAVIQEALLALDVHEEPAVTDDARSAEPSPDTSAEPDSRIDDVFAKLREAPPEPTPKPVKQPKAAPVDSSQTEAPDPGDAETDDAPVDAVDTEGAGADPTPEPTDDDVLRARRDAVLAPLLPDLLRSAKRLLQDEQNVLLDAVRRARQRVSPSRLLPEPVHHRDAWAAVLGTATDVAYASGRTSGGRRRRPVNAPPRVINELSAGLVAPLRERLTVTIEAVIAEGPYASPAELHRALAGAIGARYREWKGSDLERHLGDVLTAAYARGTYDATPSGAQLRWVPERPGQCPDCDDNALEPTIKAQHFPTGQAAPPAHPGCRCLVVPVGAPVPSPPDS